MNCHECLCHLAPPCSACVDCQHWDHPECENDCHDCADHEDDQ